MVFVDGENLAIRLEKALTSAGYSDPSEFSPEIIFRRNTYIWGKVLIKGTPYKYLRTYYYAMAQGDASVEEIANVLKEAGVEVPRVFQKPKGRSAKQVDISLATDMLTHAFRNHYDVAVLYAGDQDYVPLVEAVMREGKRVELRFVENGLSPKLRMACDNFVQLI